MSASPMTKRWILCLDASAPRTCVALGWVEAGASELVVADAREDRANQASATLDLRLRAALDEAGLDPRDLSYVACGRGPGTFTGSRVAVATAKGLALGLGIPILPVSTLAALSASGQLSETTAQPGTDRRRVLALLDARRAQVYAGVFELGAAPAALELVGAEQVIELAQLIPTLDGPETLTPVGPGCKPYADALPDTMRARAQTIPGPTPAGLFRAAVSALAHGAAIDAGALRATYLRESYAEMGINKPKRPAYRSPFV